MLYATRSDRRRADMADVATVLEERLSMMYGNTAVPVASHSGSDINGL